jgi:hypothetical protein
VLIKKNHAYFRVLTWPNNDGGGLVVHGDGPVVGGDGYPARPHPEHAAPVLHHGSSSGQHLVHFILHFKQKLVCN